MWDSPEKRVYPLNKPPLLFRILTWNCLSHYIRLGLNLAYTLGARSLTGRTFILEDLRRFAVQIGFLCQEETSDVL